MMGLATPRGRGVVALAILLAAGACGTDTPPPDAPPGAPTLAAIREDIFNSSCGLSSCHAPPTLAAKLDLHNNGLCSLLVSHTSCLFPNKVLVVPGKPEASFLLDKLRGTNLTEDPDPACATSNVRMPLGLPEMSGNKFAQIEQWIRDGAPCGDDVPVDAGVPDTVIDGGDNTPAEIATFTAAKTTLRVGERVQGAVTLTKPSIGQTVTFEFVNPDDTAVLGVMPFIYVDPGVSSLTYEVLGKMPTDATTLLAATGANSKSLTFAVLSAAAAADPASREPPARSAPRR